MTEEKFNDNAENEEQDDTRNKFRKILQSGEDETNPPENGMEGGGTRIFGTDFESGNPDDNLLNRGPVEDETPKPGVGMNLPLSPGRIPAAPISVTPSKPLPTPPQALSNTPTPKLSKPAVDSSGMPLPRRVDQIDINATRAIPVRKLPTESSTMNGQTPHIASQSQTVRSAIRSWVALTCV